MLGAWPVVSLGLFFILPFRRALLWSVFAGYLLLPSATRFTIPGFPDLDKASIVGLGAVLGCLLFGSSRSGKSVDYVLLVLVLLFVFSPLLTAMTNPDPITGARLFFPGMTFYDGLTLSVANALTIIPFLIGRRFLAHRDGHRDILVVMASAMLLYSLPILLEIRISPQLHRWIYGFFPHSFGQQMRDGGFRAVVFMQHGLVVALFLALATIALITLARRSNRVFGMNARWLVAYLGTVMILQKSLGSLLLAIPIGLTALLARPRRQAYAAAALGLIVVTYPVLRSAHLIPIETVSSATADYSSDRAGSFQTRIVNEERLLAKAQERPWFGWGTWGRNRVYDLEEGRDVSITDGTWIIVLGSFGWAGYIGLFGLLTYPLLKSGLARGANIEAETAGVMLALALNLCDLVPNSSLTPITWLLAGSLAGKRQRSSPNSNAQDSVLRGSSSVSRRDTTTSPLLADKR